MSRLIDADELEKVMTEEWFLEIIATHDSKSAIKKDIVNAIDNIPTAFDVDKVVEQLEEKQNDVNGNTSLHYLYSEGYSDGMDYAIEIVKAGGINENN